MAAAQTQTQQTRHFLLTAVLFAASLLMGGSTRGVFADSLLQLLALLLLAALAWPDPRALLPRGAAWWPLVIVLVPLWQLLPLPADLWAGLGGRAPLAAQLASVGLVPEAHVDLVAYSAERALWSLLPATALYLSALRLSPTQQKKLLALLLLVAFASVLMGLAQVAGGPDSPLRLHRPTNPGAAVGFFANRNHYASLLIMALPLAIAAAAWSTSERLAERDINPLQIVALAGVAVVLILGAALSLSRAGLLLGMLAILLSVPMVLSLRKRRGSKRVLAVIAAVGLMLTVQFALLGIVQRLEKDPLDDGRWQYAHLTAAAARDFAPLGSGLGSFRQVYQPYEAKASPERVIVNHTHNDFVETWLEAGWPGLAAMAVMIGFIAWLGVLAWARSSGSSGLMMRASSIALLTVCLHSLVDYPLRTTAIEAVVAVLLAVVVSGRFGERDRAADNIA